MARSPRRAPLSSRTALGAALGVVALGPLARGASAQGAATRDAASPSRPRVTLGADLGAAWAEYDGYLPSAVASLSPALGLRHGGLGIALRGALSRFESGSTSASGDARVAWLLPAVGRATVELGGEGGTLFYRAGRASVNDWLGTARLHVVGEGAGSAWIGGGTGRVATELARRPVTRLEGGIRSRIGALALAASVERTRAGSARHAEFAVASAWRGGRAELALEGGLRADEAASATRGWAEAGGTLWLSRRHGLAFGAGRYLADPATGTPGARYASLAVRIGTDPSRASPRQAAPGAPRLLALLGLPPPEPPPVVRVAEAVVVEAGPGGVSVAVTAPGAAAVEVAGDFSDWAPVALARDSSGTWRVALALEPGPHRLNVRVDGGPWGVPPGLPLVADDFGGSAGLFVVRGP